MEYFDLKSTGQGLTNTPVSLADVKSFTDLHFVNYHALHSYKIEEDGKLKLHLSFYTYMFFQGLEVYQFHNRVECLLIEDS